MKQVVAGGFVLFCLLIAFRVLFLVPQHPVNVRPASRPVVSKAHTGTSVSMGDAVRELRQRVDSLRAPVEELLDKLQPATTPPAAKMSPNHALVFHKRSDSIFVIMSSYNDDACATTINNMFSAASAPTNVHVGLVEQRRDETPSCIDQMYKLCNLSTFCATDQIRHRIIPAQVAKGATWARSVAAQQYRGEQYVLLVDSHTIFAKNWDTSLLEQHREARNEANGMSAVLSFLPVETTEGEASHVGEQFQRQCVFAFKEKGLIDVSGRTAKLSKVRKALTVSSHFLFAEARMLAQVPFDPSIQFLKDGVDFLYAARLWTNGFELFEPRSHLVFRRKVSSNSAVFDDVAKNVWGPLQQQSKSRVSGIIAGDAADDVRYGKFGLGIARSMTQFELFVGLDVKKGAAVRDMCEAP